MGIAWIGNVLFFDVNLIFVAYIMTIFIAGQGIIIFILFVPLSKQVHVANVKCHLLLEIIHTAGKRCLFKMVEHQEAAVFISQQFSVPN